MYLMISFLPSRRSTAVVSPPRTGKVSVQMPVRNTAEGNNCCEESFECPISICIFSDDVFMDEVGQKRKRRDCERWSAVIDSAQARFQLRRACSLF